MSRFRAFDGLRGPKGHPAINPSAARGLVYWSDFRDGGGGSVKNLVSRKETGATVAMENSDWGRDNFGSFLHINVNDEHADLVAISSTLLALSAPFTVCVWMKSDGYPTTRGSMLAAQSNSGSASGFDLRFENSGTNPASGLVFGTHNWSAQAAFFAAASFDISALNCYAGRWDGTNAAAFVNGQKGADVSNTGPQSFAMPMRLGVGFNDAFADRNATGKYYSARVYNRALSNGEIAALYNSRTRFDLYKRPRVRALLPVAGPAPTGIVIFRRRIEGY